MKIFGFKKTRINDYDVYSIRLNLKLTLNQAECLKKNFKRSTIEVPNEFEISDDEGWSTLDDTVRVKISFATFSHSEFTEYINKYKKFKIALNIARAESPLWGAGTNPPDMETYLERVDFAGYGDMLKNDPANEIHQIFEYQENNNQGYYSFCNMNDLKEENL